VIAVETATGTRSFPDFNADLDSTSRPRALCLDPQDSASGTLSSIDRASRAIMRAMQCPKCRQEVMPMPVGFTWWGGLIGSKIINHVECPMCHSRFNGRTGADNTGAIAIYMVVTGLIVGVLLFFVFRSMRF
jgi:hypothetical protein